MRYSAVCCCVIPVHIAFIDWLHQLPVEILKISGKIEVEKFTQTYTRTRARAATRTHHDAQKVGRYRTLCSWTRPETMLHQLAFNPPSALPFAHCTAPSLHTQLELAHSRKPAKMAGSCGETGTRRNVTPTFHSSQHDERASVRFKSVIRHPSASPHASDSMPQTVLSPHHFMCSRKSECSYLWTRHVCVVSDRR